MNDIFSALFKSESLRTTVLVYSGRSRFSLGLLIGPAPSELGVGEIVGLIRGGLVAEHVPFFVIIAVSWTQHVEHLANMHIILHWVTPLGTEAVLPAAK